MRFDDDIQKRRRRAGRAMRVSRASVKNVASRRTESCHENPWLRVLRRRGPRLWQVGVRVTRGFTHIIRR